jgi:hypothetical protein
MEHLRTKALFCLFPLPRKSLLCWIVIILSVWALYVVMPFRSVHSCSGGGILKSERQLLLYDLPTIPNLYGPALGASRSPPLEQNSMERFGINQDNGRIIV